MERRDVGARAYWGANLISWGTDGTVSRRYMGALPAVGQWVRLEVPAAQVGLEGRTLNGMAFTLYGGRATWDAAGKASATSPQTYQVSGTVALSGVGLGGVTLTATGGVSCGSTSRSGDVQLHGAVGVDGDGDADAGGLHVHAGVAQLQQRDGECDGAGLCGGGRHRDGVGGGCGAVGRDGGG